MCREFHCECCPDDLPQLSCVCDGCSHDDKAIKTAGLDTDKRTDNLDMEKVDSRLDHPDSTVESSTQGQATKSGKESDSFVQVMNQVDEIETPPCCKEETVGANTCCEQGLACKSAEASPCECGTTNRKDQNIGERDDDKSCPVKKLKMSCCQSDAEREACCTSHKELDSRSYSCQKSCSQSTFIAAKSPQQKPRQSKPCCSSEKQCDAKVNASVNIAAEEVAQTTACQNKPCCSSIKQCDAKVNASVNIAVEKVAQTTACQNKPCSSKKQCDDKINASVNIAAEEVAQTTACQSKPCCSSIKQYNERELESFKNEDKPKTGCLFDPFPTEKGDSCCSDSKTCSTKVEGKDESLLLEGNSNPEQSDKCCQKQNRGECSTDVEMYCSKVDEEAVLLIKPSNEHQTPPSSIAPLRHKALPVQKHTTKLRVQNICCAMEAQLVQDCLKPLQGVESVAVNVIGRVVHVRHNPELASPTALVESLNRVHLGATVMEMGGQDDKDQEVVPFRLKLLFIYVFLQTVLLITSVSGLFLNQSWHMWVAIAEIIFGGAPILKRGVLSVKNRNLDINILMLIAVIGTLAISEWVEGATVVYVFAFADALQKFCMFRVQRTLSRLMLKRPEVAVLVATGESVPIENVAVGTLIAIRPGELIPLDGVVVKGNAAVDESSITGESLPVEKTVFSKVYSGTVNQNGYIEVETTSDSSSSTVSKVAQMVQEAQSSSTKTEAIINRFAKYYTPLVVLVAALVVIIPAILGASGVGSYLQDIREWGRRALVMLVIACPCALVMATPIAVVCSITAAARKGVLVKGGEHLETLSKIRILAFDKTGTLTEGKFQVKHMEYAYGVNERDVLRLAAGLESKTVHPIAAAIVNEFSGCVTQMVRNQIDNFPEVSQFKIYEGQGISGIIEGKLVRVGNKEMFDQCGATLNETMAEKYELWSTESNTVVFVCVDEKLVLMIGLADAIRSNTSISLEWLRNIGVQTSMLTGDNPQTAEAVRRNLGIDECISEMKPHEKLAWIQKTQSSKREEDPSLSLDEEDHSSKCCTPSHDNYVMVGMVGDGVNDGPALASANVGIAMGAGGTALAVEAADVALMSNNLASIPELICLAKFCNQIVKQNIVFSVLLKICIVIVALLGYVTLWMAVVADVVGLLFVIINGLRPLIWKASKTNAKENTDIELVSNLRVKHVHTYQNIV